MHVEAIGPNMPLPYPIANSGPTFGGNFDYCYHDNSKHKYVGTCNRDVPV